MNFNNSAFYVKTKLTTDRKDLQIMLSRRNIRIKVMQMLYCLSRDKDLTLKEAIDQYNGRIDESYELYHFNLYFLLKVAEYAVTDGKVRLAKHLPSEMDKIFTPKIYNNDLVRAINSGKVYHEFSSDKFMNKLDKDSIRRYYTEFAKKDEYKAYLKKTDCTNADHLEILLGLYKYLVKTEATYDDIEELYPVWIDDYSLVLGTVKKTLKGLPDSTNFSESYKPDYEAVTEFGQELLKQVIERDAELLEHIEPTLKNWDAERVAIIDMILLKMALCELISFPTIPTKVTLNEFVEISKLYSTDKSKDFINGILDRLMKQLKEAGKIKKEGRGLVD